MVKDKWICLTCLFLLLLAGGGFGKTKVDEDLTRVVSTFLQLDSARTSIEIRKSPFDSSFVEYDSLQCIPLTKAPPRGLVSFQVTAYQGGQLIATGQARAYITHFDNVLISKDRINRHEIINKSCFALERREITFLAEKPLTSFDELSGKWAMRSIARDQIVTSSMLEVKPDIIAGHEVALQIQKGGLSITARGIALDSGRRGEQIRVKNAQSGKIISGTIVDNETIEIGLL